MKKQVIFNLALLCALILGVLCGLLHSPFLRSLSKEISEIFMNILKLISLPMIFLALVSTITRMKNLAEAKILLQKILKYTIATTLIAAAIGLALFFLIGPNAAGKTTDGFMVASGGHYFSFLKKMIPSNLVEPFIENNVLGMAFIATCLSIAILKLPEKRSLVLKDFFGGLFEAFLKITSGVILLMPIAIFAFTVQFIENIQNSSEDLQKLFFYGLCVIAANLIQGFVVLPLFLKWKGISPAKLAHGMMPALVMAFFSKSSNATLPLSLKSATHRLNISEKTAQFSFPLCSIINMNGCAAFILITVLFVCKSQGIVFSLGGMLSLILLSTVAAIGNAGVPMGCFFLTTAFLVGMNVPIEMMGIILPLYSLFDMVETALNVWSDSSITAVVDRELELQHKMSQAKKILA